MKRRTFLFILSLSLCITSQRSVAQDYSHDIAQAKISSEQAMQQYMKEVKNLNVSPEVTGVSLAPKELLPGDQTGATSQAKRQLPTLMVFISFSMPEQSVKKWVMTAKKWHATLVIRGLIDNSFKKTLLALRQITKDNIGGISLNPIAFRKFHIDKVPAIVVTKDNLYQGDEEYADPGDYDVVYGDVSLDFALNQIITKQGVATEQAKKLLMQQEPSHEA